MFKTASAISIILLFCSSCEEVIDLKLAEGEEKMVVEGYIEPDRYPFLTFSRSVSFFSPSAVRDFKNTFLHDVQASISSGDGQTFDLIMIPFKQLPDSLKEYVKDIFSIDVKSPEFLQVLDIPFYTCFELRGKEKTSYLLKAFRAGHYIESLTMIPPLPYPDSVWYQPHKNVKKDTQFVFRYKMQEAPNENNYYRFYTKRNSEPFFSGRYGSAFDDAFFQGKEVNLYIRRGESIWSDYDPDTYGYFFLGDTVTVRFCSIDEASYRFWRSFESDQNSGGPYAKPTIIDSNVEGGLGIWCGLGSYYYRTVVRK